MIAIVQYNAGNTTSVRNAVESLGYNTLITEDEALLQQADKVIFPGVGEAASAMHYLKERGLDKIICSLKQPLLGICLGMQLLCRHTEEGDTTGMGIFDAVVKKFPLSGIVPHMGWNNCSMIKEKLFRNLTTECNFYFVHSYYATIGADTIAKAEYLLPFSAALQKRNFYGTQFHPEKSGDKGMRLLQNFLGL